jgi:hypothetical protein
MKSTHAGRHVHVEDAMLMIARFGQALVAAAMVIGLAMMAGARWGDEAAIAAMVVTAVAWLLLVISWPADRHPPR